MEPTVASSRCLALQGMRRWRPQLLRYGWSAAIWLRGLGTVIDPGGVDPWPYLRAVYASWGRRSGAVGAADEALPGGVAAWLARRAGLPEGEAACDRFSHYLATQPVNSFGAFDHVGPTSPLRKWMRIGEALRFTAGPRSSWADSMMMYVWSAWQLGLWRREAKWRAFAVSHALALVRALQRPSGLFAHARDEHRVYPRGPVAWLRAQGWMLAVLADFRAEGELSPASELEERFQHALRAILKQQRQDGSWPNVLGAHPHSRFELSGNALVLYTLARAARPQSTEERALEAGWNALCRRCEIVGRGRLLLRGGSHTTPARWSGERYDRGVYATWSRLRPGVAPHVYGTVLMAASAMRARR